MCREWETSVNRESSSQCPAPCIRFSWATWPQTPPGPATSRVLIRAPYQQRAAHPPQSIRHDHGRPGPKDYIPWPRAGRPLLSGIGPGRRRHHGGGRSPGRAGRLADARHQQPPRGRLRGVRVAGRRRARFAGPGRRHGPRAPHRPGGHRRGHAEQQQERLAAQRRHLRHRGLRQIQLRPGAHRGGGRVRLGHHCARSGSRVCRYESPHDPDTPGETAGPVWSRAQGPGRFPGLLSRELYQRPQGQPAVHAAHGRL